MYETMEELRKADKYDIIYADPPWSYYNDMTVNPDCTTVKGMRRPPYPVMSSKDIMNLPVQNLTNDNYLLFILFIKNFKSIENKLSVEYDILLAAFDKVFCKAARSNG